MALAFGQNFDVLRLYSTSMTALFAEILLVSFCIAHADLAPEETVRQDKVDGGENHTKNPPDQPYRLAVLRA